jgi:glyoxylase-like metal-dependent hydrolase (beta-lactamase superfamily II)
MFRRSLAAAALALSALAAPACGAPSDTGAAESFPIVRSSASSALETFTSDESGFDTHSFWLDTGAEVVVFDAQFTEPLARKVIADIQAKTKSPIKWVVVTHPNPDKFQGAGPFRALGAKIIAGRHTADAIPGTYAYKKAYFVGAKMFTQETYPPPPVVDETFEGSHVLPLHGALSVELRELRNPGVSSTQTVAYVRELGALVVGDLVHHEAHAWLEGGIVNGAPHPDLDAWKRALDELGAYPSGTMVYGGRGRPAALETAVADQKAYLDGLKAIVTAEVKATGAPVATLAGSGAAAVYARIQARAAAAYPTYELPYMIGYGVYGLAQATAKDLESTKP